VPPDLDRFLVYKGSIAIDGISLTIADITDRIVRIAIIPHTYHATNLSRRRPGDRVNIECDILAKHVEKLFSLLQT
jgi:riboflavin synthase